MTTQKIALLTAVLIILSVIGILFHEQISTIAGIGRDNPAEQSRIAAVAPETDKMEAVPSKVTDQVKQGRLSCHPAKYWETVGDKNE